MKQRERIHHYEMNHPQTGKRLRVLAWDVADARTQFAITLGLRATDLPRVTYTGSTYSGRFSEPLE